MDAGHHGGMGTAEIQLHHGQAAVLDGAGDIAPTADLLGPDTADQMGAAFGTISLAFLEIRDPLFISGGGIARAAVENEILGRLAMDNLPLGVHDRVFGVLRQLRHVLHIRQSLDDGAAGTGIKALLDQIRTVGRLDGSNHHGILEIQAAEFNFGICHFLLPFHRIRRATPSPATHRVPLMGGREGGGGG